jgi:processing peptidase subunit beta
MLRVLRGASRLARQQAKAADACQARAFAAGAEVAVTGDESPFLRYATPVPQLYSYANLLGSIPSTQVTQLPNGLRVGSETAPFAETATVGVWIDAGSRYETDANNGSAHFLEHMAFKGTRELELEIEDMGGHLNAYTSREQTCYHAKVFKRDVPKAINILSDIIQNSHLKEDAIERERSVILREMQEVEGIPEEVIFDHLHATAFQATPLGRTILGPAENIRRLTRGDLADYIGANYTAPRMVVAAAGAVDHDELVKLSEDAFSSLSTDPTTAYDLVAKEPSYFTGSDVRIRDPDMSLLHFAVAFKGVSWADADSIPLMIMQQILGGWNKNAGAGKNMGSPLAQTVAANNLCNSYQAFNTNYHDTGLFGIITTADKNAAIDDLSWAIMHELTKLVYEVAEEDVVRARNQLKASILFGMDGSGAVAEDIGRGLLVYGRRIPKAEIFARLDAVTAETVKAVAERVIYDQDPAIAAMGDVQHLPDYNWFRRRTYWLRY